LADKPHPKIASAKGIEIEETTSTFCIPKGIKEKSG
jgi:hypothetical protein